MDPNLEPPEIEYALLICGALLPFCPARGLILTILLSALAVLLLLQHLPGLLISASRFFFRAPVAPAAPTVPAAPIAPIVPTAPTPPPTPPNPTPPTQSPDQPTPTWNPDDNHPAAVLGYLACAVACASVSLVLGEDARDGGGVAAEHVLEGAEVVAAE